MKSEYEIKCLGTINKEMYDRIINKEDLGNGYLLCKDTNNIFRLVKGQKQPVIYNSISFDFI